MKIVSLLPSATEIVCALGLGDQLAAVTHECDYPPEVQGKPIITQSILRPGLNSAEIDAAVRRQLTESQSLYTIDREMLAGIGPNLILTQQLCDVCAVAYNDVVAAVRSLPHPGPRVLNLEPNTLGEILDTITLVGMAAEREEKAAQVTSQLRQRIAFVRRTAAKAATRPRTVLLEWIDPLFGGGHWDPELVEIAGGRDSIGKRHEPSTQVSWEAIQNFAPEVLVVAQCGFGVESTLR